MSMMVYEIGITAREDGEYKNDGFFITCCPNCRQKIKFVLKGLPEDKTLSPTIDMRGEWSLSGNQETARIRELELIRQRDYGR